MTFDMVMMLMGWPYDSFDCLLLLFYFIDLTFLSLSVVHFFLDFLLLIFLLFLWASASNSLNTVTSDHNIINVTTVTNFTGIWYS